MKLQKLYDSYDMLKDSNREINVKNLNDDQLLIYIAYKTLMRKMPGMTLKLAFENANCHMENPTKARAFFSNEIRLNPKQLNTIIQ